MKGSTSHVMDTALDNGRYADILNALNMPLFTLNRALKCDFMNQDYYRNALIYSL